MATTWISSSDPKRCLRSPDRLSQGKRDRMSEAKARLGDNTREVRRLVHEYCSTQRNPSLPAFIVHGPFTRADVWNSDASRKPGCYVIYGEDGSVRYVGEFESEIGSRIANHLSPRVQQSAFWQLGSPPSHFDLIEVVELSEAPSLEAYLKRQFDADS